MNENIAYLVNTYVVSEERAKDLIEKHPGRDLDDIADDEGLDHQIWMDEEDIARENCE